MVWVMLCVGYCGYPKITNRANEVVLLTLSKNKVKVDRLIVC
jgi:hypothetical protein